MSLTNEQWMERGGVVCPNCESDLMETDDHHIEEAFVSLDVHCVSCKAKWVEVYPLAYYTDLEKDE